MKTVVIEESGCLDIYEVKDGEVVEKKVTGFRLRKAKAILASLPEIEKFVKEQEGATKTKKPSSTLEKARAASKL